MTNTVLILAISIILVSVTFIPLAEATVGWNGFLKQVGFNFSELYEVSLTIPIGISDDSLKPFSLRCSDGDRMYVVNSPTSSAELVSDPEGLGTFGDSSFLTEGEAFPSRIVGVEGLAQGTLQLFEYDITITILCLNPTPLTQVGGEWQATDTTALIIGYSVLNAYWLAPIAIGIGLGIYLTRNRLQKH